MLASNLASRNGAVLPKTNCSASKLTALASAHPLDPGVCVLRRIFVSSSIRIAPPTFGASMRSNTRGRDDDAASAAHAGCIDFPRPLESDGHRRRLDVSLRSPVVGRDSIIAERAAGRTVGGRCNGAEMSQKLFACVQPRLSRRSHDSGQPMTSRRHLRNELGQTPGSPRANLRREA